MLSPVSLPSVAYVLLFFALIIISLYVLFSPKKSHWLIVGMIVSAFFNIDIISPFWYNYILLLLFTKFDRSLTLVLWQIGIQEIWAGFNKLNADYANVINFFSKPFTLTSWLYTTVVILVICIPLAEIAIGFGLILKKKFTRYLALVLHGGAIVMLVFFIHYGEIVWLWNVFIIVLIWILSNRYKLNPFHISKKQIAVILFLACAPLLQMITTLTYPLSYRMYTGSEVSMTIDGRSYLNDYYKKAKEVSYLSKEFFIVVLKKQCAQSQFTNATISIPKFMWRKPSTISYTCVEQKLLSQ
jgi:hypothetical protein